MVDGPLAGRRIVVTRPHEQSGRLAAELGDLGAEVLVVPLIEITSADKSRKSAMRDLQRFEWLVFTSANGVATFSEIPGAEWLLRNVHVAVVGPGTRAAVRRLGVDPAYMPERFAADQIALGLGDLDRKRVLLVQSDIASEALAQELRARGAHVSVLRTYRTIAVDPPRDQLDELAKGADAIVLASGSAARSLASVAARVPRALDALLVYIGPKTAQAARDAGLPEGLIAREATSEGIIRALVSHFGEKAR